MMRSCQQEVTKHSVTWQRMGLTPSRTNGKLAHSRTHDRRRELEGWTSDGLKPIPVCHTTLHVNVQR